MTTEEKIEWKTLCRKQDLVAGSGVCALAGGSQIALFYLPNAKNEIFAINNHDPVGGANVLSRGIVGDLGGRLVVASPLYKQHFDLVSGECLEEENMCVETYSVRIEGDAVQIAG